MASIACAVLCAIPLNAQVPTKCLEIESILVDACTSADCLGSTEGMNEMVRFITGPDPIALSDLQFEFYNSAFLGIAENTATDSLTGLLNAAIGGCGHLLEPPGGIILPGSEVIFITSTQMCVEANSFAALSDTLYVIFQNPGNLNGHFRNNDLVDQPLTPTPGPPLLRWLRMSVTSTGCGDTATYDAGQLPNIYGTYGGSSAENDGATVEFAWPGEPVATYLDPGCQAPFIATVPTVVSGEGPIPCGMSASLTGSVSGAFTAVIWQGGGGTFGNAEALSTSYTPGGGDMGDVDLSFCAVTACGDTICSQATVTVSGPPPVDISGDTTLCGSLATTMLTASGADTYVWSNGSPTASISVDVMGAGIYWVAGTSACGTDTAYVTVTAMTNTLSYTDVSCAGAGDGSLSIEGSGGSEPYTYLWSTGSTGPQITGLTPGPYSVTITDAEGCAQDASYEITEPPLLTATVGADTTICPGGQAILTAQGAGGTPAYVYTWSPEGPLVSPTETTTYTVLVSDAHGCEAAPLQMTVIIPAGQEVLFSSTGLDGCVPHCITFTASSPAMNSYAWDLGDGTTSNDTVVEHCYDTTGVYTVNVVVVQASGCPDITSAFGPFTIGTAPIANFSWSPEALTIADPTVAFSDLSTDATSWSWQFDDPAGSSSTDPSPAFVFPGASCYTVSLEVMNDLGCTDSTASEICIQGPDVLVIPNVFSPNDDGNNDLFRISGGDLRQLEVHVFNRWGQQVATLERVRQSWDGRSPAGDVLSAGTYFYTLHAVSNGGDVYDRQGTVTLVR